MIFCKYIVRQHCSLDLPPLLRYSDIPASPRCSTILHQRSNINCKSPWGSPYVRLWMFPVWFSCNFSDFRLLECMAATKRGFTQCGQGLDPVLKYQIQFWCFWGLASLATSDSAYELQNRLRSHLTVWLFFAIGIICQRMNLACLAILKI